MSYFLRLLLTCALLLLPFGRSGKQAIAQEYEGCWMIDSLGAVVDLNGAVCPRSPAASELRPLSFSNLRIESTSNGQVSVSGSVTNANSQSIPLVLVEYKLVDPQSQEIFYKGMVSLETSGALPAGASVNFSRVLNARRLPQKPLSEIAVQVIRYL